MIKYVITIFLLIFSGCDNTPANKAPVAEIVASSSVHAKEELTLDAIMSDDSDGKVVAYQWKDQNQNILGTSRKVTWTAPANAGDYNLTLVVTDDDGATDTASVMIKVIKKPTAKITATSTTITLAEVITLSGESSKDSDGNITKYRWSDGNEDINRSWTSYKLGENRVSLTVTDNDGATGTDTIMIDVQAPTGPFSKIKTLLLQSKYGVVQGARYICVGDSTRANGKPYYGGTVFREIQKSLDPYNVDSYLRARAGHEAKQFNTESNSSTLSPTWDEIVDLIPDDGNTTIVDISLGINDLWDGGTIDSIKQDLRQSIEKIKARRAKTLFMLTMPFARKGSAVADSIASQYSYILKEAYKELSDDLDLPLVDIQESMTFRDDEYRDDEIAFHLIPSAQREVANLIKGVMLP